MTFFSQEYYQRDCYKYNIRNQFSTFREKCGHTYRQTDRQEIKKYIFLLSTILFKCPSIHFSQNYKMYRQNIFTVLLHREIFFKVSPLFLNAQIASP